MKLSKEDIVLRNIELEKLIHKFFSKRMNTAKHMEEVVADIKIDHSDLLDSIKNPVSLVTSIITKQIRANLDEVKPTTYIWVKSGTYALVSAPPKEVDMKAIKQEINNIKQSVNILLAKVKQAETPRKKHVTKAISNEDDLFGTSLNSFTLPARNQKGSLQ